VLFAHDIFSSVLDLDQTWPHDSPVEGEEPSCGQVGKDIQNKSYGPKPCVTPPPPPPPRHTQSHNTARLETGV
jgi:hypothetical protein